MLRTSSLIIFLVCVFGEELPDYIPRCKFVEYPTCGPDASNKALPILLQGDSHFGIPNFFPLLAGDTSIDDHAVRLTLNNCKLYGIETVHVFETSFASSVGIIGFTIEKLSLVGQFQPGGKLLGATLPRAGVANFTLEKGKYRVFLHANLKPKSNGERYVFPFKAKVEIDPENSVYSFSEDYGSSASQPYVVVENLDALNKVIIPKMEAVLKFAFLQAVVPLYNKVPFNLFFTDL